MFFSLDVRRARKGDCLILHYGTEEKPGLILIDGGPDNVYQPHLQPRLGEIRDARGLDPEKSLQVDLLMISHVDDDHIAGILELTKELVEAKEEDKPLPVRIKSFWHNTFDDIIGKDPKELTAAVTAQFGPAALDGEPDTEGLDPDVAKVLAGIAQGIRLRDDVRNLKLPLNPEFDGGLVMATEEGGSLDMGKGLTFTIAGPMKAELIALQKAHDAWLKKQEEEKKKKETLAAFSSQDTSVPNLSSLVILAEAGEGGDRKTMLLTGDARGDKILKGMELVGLLEPGGGMHVDILKMPHHGSDRNVRPDFFERITADHYVFSGNGEHGNPDRETLQMLLDANGDAELTIHLTYPIDEIDVEREKDWIKQQNEEIKRKMKNPNVKVREDWSHEKNSLEAFFATHTDFAKKVRIVEEDEPHVIDLLDEIGF